jgi:adenylate cyclase
LLAVPLALFVAVVTILLPIALAAALSLAGAALWTGLAVMLFGQAQLLPLLAPLLAALATFIAVLAVRFIYLDRQGRFLRRAFGSYVAPALVDQLVANPERLKLGGERREMSFLFTDLAGFTGMVEKIDPEEAVRLLNTYLDQMIEIAKANGGTIDKMIGDAVVVLFSAPVDQTNHAELATACALEMDAFANHFAAEQKARGIPFGITRIGVHSGTAIVGNFGGSGFFDYTALGDAMNTAARLESANKQFGTRIAISGETVRRCPGFTGRKIGDIILKGKREPTKVYEPMADETKKSDGYERYRAAYALMAGRARGARKAFETLADDYPDDGLVAFHLARLKAGDKGEVIELLEK